MSRSSSTRRVRAAVAAVIAAAPCSTAFAGGVTLQSVTPDRQRVHEIITLRGSGFGAFEPGTSGVLFDGEDLDILAGLPYVWRDDFIQIRVPVGTGGAGGSQPIPKTPLLVSVIGVNGQSGALPFQVNAIQGGSLSFVQRTNLHNDQDVSGFLGTTADNIARTKDAEFGDVDGDGDLDIVDNNSNNSGNSTHNVLRFNNAGLNFTAMDLEPNSAADEGDFATVIPPGGTYIGNGIQYDADLVDLTNDGLPEVVQAVAGGTALVRILVNNEGGVPGMFLEQTLTWIPSPNYAGSPDDIAHADVNGDGFVDIAVGLRFSPTGQVFINQNGTTFTPGLVVSRGAGSMHDIFFIDADDDHRHDVVLVSESSALGLFLNNGAGIPTFEFESSFGPSCLAGVAADLNADGLLDIGAVGVNVGRVFLNNPASPGSFTESTLSGTNVGYIYDIEAGDVDLDGDVDLFAPAINQNPDLCVRIWMNNGDGTFVHVTAGGATDVLAGLGPYERLSADLFDFDEDGDLDLYVTGADGQNIGFGFGAVPNQFYESRVICPGDLNGDGAVGIQDLIELLGSWGACPGCPADLDDDGIVGIQDLITMLASWGPCT